MHRAIVSEYLIDLVDEYFGNLIEEIVMKYYKDSIDLEIEYENILLYIVDKLTEGKEEYGDPVKFRELMRKLGHKRGVSKLLVSYLISKYIEEENEENNIVDEI